MSGTSGEYSTDRMYRGWRVLSPINLFCIITVRHCYYMKYDVRYSIWYGLAFNGGGERGQPDYFVKLDFENNS